jgi:hypothetical protein
MLMSYRNVAAKCCRSCVVFILVVGASIVMPSASIYGDTTTDNTTVVSTRAVGGISINADGILDNAKPDALGQLAKLRSESLTKAPGDLNAAAPMREISLRRLEGAIDDCAKNDKPLPDTIKYLAGLQRIQYVFVYPEQKDIVLVGPGEGWKVDGKGNIVGVTTGRPVMLLDDLLVALRTAKAAAQGGITCSIDPTPEGMARIQKTVMPRGVDSSAAMAAFEKALGMQQITVTGVPDTSHFARVLVAADYRMKRIAMAFDPSPVHGLPNYLGMVKPGKAMVSPRFWLEPKFDALLCDADGLAFEFAGARVKAMTEEDYIASSGTVQHSGKANPAAQRWANIMTEKYPELAVADPIFGQLQNCMELAVVGALIVKNNLPEKAGYDMPTLMNSPAVKAEEFNAPKQVASIASILEKGKNRVVSVSGGVAINSWAIADKVKASDKVAPVRTKAAFSETSGWWRN